MTDRITPDSLREMANPLRPTGNCFSIGLIDGTLRLHALGPSLFLPGLESCSLLNESIWRATGDRAHRRAAPTIGSGMGVNTWDHYEFKHDGSTHLVEQKQYDAGKPFAAPPVGLD